MPPASVDAPSAPIAARRTLPLVYVPSAVPSQQNQADRTDPGTPPHPFLPRPAPWPTDAGRPATLKQSHRATHGAPSGDHGGRPHRRLEGGGGGGGLQGRRWSRERRKVTRPATGCQVQTEPPIGRTRLFPRQNGTACRSQSDSPDSCGNMGTSKCMHGMNQT